MTNRPYLIHLLAFAILLAIASRCLGAELKDVAIGDKPTREQLRALLGPIVTSSNRSPRGELLIAPGAYSGFAVIDGMSCQTIVVLDAQLRLDLFTVTFASVYFDQLAGLAIALYGKPVTEGAVDQQTAAGGSVRNVELDWILPNRTAASLVRYVGEINHGQLKLESEAHAKLSSGLFTTPPVSR